MGRPAAMRPRRLRRISCLTGSDTQPDARSSPIVPADGGSLSTATPTRLETDGGTCDSVIVPRLRRPGPKPAAAPRPRAPAATSADSVLAPERTARDLLHVRPAGVLLGDLGHLGEEPLLEGDRREAELEEVPVLDEQVVLGGLVARVVDVVDLGPGEA